MISWRDKRTATNGIERRLLQAEAACTEKLRGTASATLATFLQTNQTRK